MCPVALMRSRCGRPLWDCPQASRSRSCARCWPQRAASRYFLGATAPLTRQQVRFAFRLDAPERSERMAATQSLRAVFRQIALNWNVQQRTLWRPPLDPMLLLTDLRRDAAGLPILPGGRRFWTLVFDEDAPREGSGLDTALERLPVDFAWLADQVFIATGEQRRLATPPCCMHPVSRRGSRRGTPPTPSSQRARRWSTRRWSPHSGAPSSTILRLLPAPRAGRRNSHTSAIRGGPSARSHNSREHWLCWSVQPRASLSHARNALT